MGGIHGRNTCRYVGMEVLPRIEDVIEVRQTSRCKKIVREFDGVRVYESICGLGTCDVCVCVRVLV